REWMDSFFDGTRTGEEDFPFGRPVRNVEEGDYLYLIYHGRIHGRLLITRIEHARRRVRVGTHGQHVEAQTVVWVECPGESAGERNIRRDSHRGHRWDDVPEW